jgi:hypothetical protein
MVVFAPAAKMYAVAIDDTPQTIFAAGITRIISHNFSFSPRYFYIHTIFLVMLWNQLLIRGYKQLFQNILSAGLFNALH